MGADAKDYEQEKIPTEWRDSVIIPIFFKEKGYIQDVVVITGDKANIAYYEDFGEDH